MKLARGTMQTPKSQIRRNKLILTTMSWAGFWMVADDFLEGARTVIATEKVLDYAERALLFHSIEMFLKSVLRRQRLRGDELKDIGHDIPALARRAVQGGFALSPETIEQLEAATPTELVFSARYPTHGHARGLEMLELLKLAQDVREAARHFLWTTPNRPAPLATGQP